MRSVWRSFAVLILLQGAWSCATGGVPAATYPDSTWNHADAGKAGFDVKKLNKVLRYADSLATTSMVVVWRGHVMAEFGDVSETSYVASVRKSILSMLYGAHLDRGVIDLESTLEDLSITDVGGLLPVERRAKVRDILAARSGVYHPPGNGGDDSEHSPDRGSVRPGTYFLYNNWDFNVLGTILELRTGRDVFDLLEHDLAAPLQMEDFDGSRHWKWTDTLRSIHRAYHMVLSTRDMARLGYVMLREGRWKKQQLIPARWVRQSTRLVTLPEELNPPELRGGTAGYGYLWWVFDERRAGPEFEGAYTAEGAFGQYITVLPALDIVVAHKVKVPPYDREVTRDEYIRLLEMIVSTARSSGRN